MKKYALSLAVLALIGQASAVKIAKQVVSADDYDSFDKETSGPVQQNIAQAKTKNTQEPEENFKE